MAIERGKDGKPCCVPKRGYTCSCRKKSEPKQKRRKAVGRGKGFAPQYQSATTERIVPVPITLDLSPPKRATAEAETQTNRERRNAAVFSQPPVRETAEIGVQATAPTRRRRVARQPVEISESEDRPERFVTRSGRLAGVPAGQAERAQYHRYATVMPQQVSVAPSRVRFRDTPMISAPEVGTTAYNRAQLRSVYGGMTAGETTGDESERRQAFVYTHTR